MEENASKRISLRSGNNLIASDDGEDEGGKGLSEIAHKFREMNKYLVQQMPESYRGTNVIQRIIDINDERKSINAELNT